MGLMSNLGGLTMSTTSYARFRSLVILSLLSVLLWGGTSSAQTTYGRIVGDVTDATGAPMPNVTVTVRNLDTNAQRSIQTTDVGYYVFPDLAIGNYEVSVGAPGFKRYVQGPLKLLVDLTLRADIKLSIGSVKEAVTVTGDQPVITTDQSSLGEVMQDKTVSELPLDGRNFTEIAQLAPGAAQGAPNTLNRFRSYGSIMTSNGGRASTNNYLIDGVDNTAFIIGMQLVTPSIDAIGEMKVETANFSADLGQTSGAVVNVAIKSGTNQFHGTAYDFLRNDALDAKEYFASTKLPLRQNQFGGSVGGPIIKNKAFFFFNYEGLRSVSSSPYFYFVPTAAMKAGDFSGTWAGQQLPTVYDPFSLDGSGNRQPFSGNMIPNNRINPIATKMLTYMPDPNSTSSGGNYQTSFSTPTKNWQINARGDYTLSSKDSLMARFSYWNSQLDDHYLNFEGDLWNWRPRNAVVGWTHVYSQNVIQEVRFGTSKYSEIDTPPYGVTTDYNKLVGLPEFPLPGTGFGFPTLTIANADPGFAADGFSSRIENHFQGQYHLSITHGKHAIKVGTDVMRYQDKNGYSYNLGTYDFNGEFTSPIGQRYPNGFADFLLGLPDSQTLSNTTAWDYTRLRNTRVQSYVQDDVRVASNLTLNLGLRWDWYGPWTDKNNRFQYFDFATGEEVYPGALKLPYSLPYPHRFDPKYTAVQNAKNKQFAPRVGFAWRPFGSDHTVIQGAYGIFWGLVAGYDFANQSSQGAGLALQEVDSSSSTSPTLTFGTFTNIQNLGSLVPAIPTTFTNSPDLANPYTQQWNFGIQRELMKDTALKVFYVGSKTTHLADGKAGNFSYPPTTGNFLTTLKYPNFGGIRDFQSDFWSNYNALQVSVERRFAQGLMFTSNYAWSKCLDNGSENWSEYQTQNPWNLSLEKGRCEQDVHHRLSTSLVYQVPFHSRVAVLRPLLEGWQTSALIALQSGFPFTVTANDLSNVGFQGPTYGITMRANYVGGSMTLPSSQRSPLKWFNTSAFAQPAAFTFGNTSRDILDGPGLHNLDLSVGKLFSITERQKVQFRAEFFNVFNHPYFTFPNSNVSSPGFGTITSTAAVENGSAGSNRVIQFALKYIF
jgi:hypothetical protein